MKNSSTKSRWPNKAAWLTGIFLAAGPASASSLVLDTRMELNSRLAYHLIGQKDLASHKHMLEFDQKAKFNDWQAIAGFRAFAEVAFASNTGRYDSSVAKTESSDLMPNDIYVQYKTPSLLARVGYQQVVWGEAFGFYFADVVNPKDTRDFGLGDMNKQRLTVPMVNLKYVLDHGALQLVYIPKPYFNRTPAMGTDFGNYYASLFPQGKLTVSDSRTLPLALENGEVGLRATTSFRGVDMAAFYFNYHDRAPNFRMSLVSPSPLEAHLEGFHPRIQTLGVTATAEQEPFLYRLEALSTFDKLVDAASAGSYTSHMTNELVGVLGVDFTKITNWRLGLQVSETYHTRAIANAITPQSRPLVTLHASGPIFREQNLEVIFTYAPNDGSILNQLRYLVPVSSRIELLFGADLLLGSPQSQFGRFESASRGYVLLKGYLMGT